MTPEQKKALNLIHFAGQGLTDKGHAIVNANVKALLDGGYIDYDSRKWVAYSLTPKGKQALYQGGIY